MDAESVASRPSRRNERGALDERQLVRLLLDGDEEFLRRFQAARGSRLMQMLRKSCYWLPRETIEEVYQDTLLKVWKNRSSYDPAKGSLRAWVYRIARNRAVDCWRAAHGKQERARRADEERQRARASSVFTRFQADAAGVLGKLSPLQRAIVLADLEVYPDRASAKLLADRLASTPGSIHSQRDKAYRRLEQLIGYSIPEGE